MRCSFCVAIAVLFPMLTAACGEPLSSAEETQTARADEVSTRFPVDPSRTPQAIPTATPAPLYPSPFPPSTPTVLTPVPSETVRDDCPSGWAVVDDADFSICYPAEDWRVEASPQTAPGNLRSYFFTHLTLDTYVGLAVEEQTPITSGAVPNLAALCDTLGLPSGIDVNVEAIETSSGLIDVCVGDGEDGLNGFDPVHGYAELSKGLHLQITAFHGENDPAIFAAVRDIVATLLLR
jgi:hypothetical protein